VRIAVTGSTGFIGSALVRALQGRGDEVHRVVRRTPGAGEVGLDLARRVLDTTRLPGQSLEGIDAAVHLAGAPLTTRWSAKRLEIIRSSRVTTGDVLARALAGLERRPAVLVSGSAVGVYGDRGEELLDESSPLGGGVIADLCRAWEATTTPAVERGIRTVTIRTGIVLGGHGGASGGILGAMRPLFKLGLGARLGNGQQWTSWVSLDDEIAALLRAIDDPELRGPVNSTAPNPVRNAELTEAIGRALGRRSRLVAPAPALRLALGREAADELLLASQRVVPKKLIDAGFTPAFAYLEDALSVALGRSDAKLGGITQLEQQ